MTDSDNARGAFPAAVTGDESEAVADTSGVANSPIGLGKDSGANKSLTFLSTEWLTALESGLRSVGPAKPGATTIASDIATGAAPTTPATEKPGSSAGLAGLAAGISLGQLVTGGPHGDTCYTIHLADREPARVIPGTLADAQITLVADYGTASGIAGGTMDTATALGQGRIRLRGDANALVKARDLLEALGPALRDLAASTYFPTSNKDHEQAESQ